MGFFLRNIYKMSHITFLKVYSRCKQLIIQTINPMDSTIECLDEDKIIQATNTMVNENLAKKYRERMNSKRKKISLTVVSLVGLVISFFAVLLLMNQDLSKLNEKIDEQIASIEFYSNPQIDTRGQNQLENKNEITQLINKGSLINALELFEKSDMSNFQVSDLFMVAQAYQKEGQYQNSQIIIEKILVNQSKLEQELNWLKALNLLKMKNYDEAKVLMESLIATRSYKWKSMKALLKELPV